MKVPKEMLEGISYLNIFFLVLCLHGCENGEKDDMDITQLEGFPPFITPIEEYFTLQIAGNHQIDSDSYRLKVSGAIDHPGEYSLEELRNLNLTD